MGNRDNFNVLSQPQLSVNIIVIIREILARKCDQLKIVVLSRNFEFAIADSEKLLEVYLSQILSDRLGIKIIFQFLHHNTDKKFSLRCFDAPFESTDTQIGFYKMFCNRYRRCKIEHLEMPKPLKF